MKRVHIRPDPFKKETWTVADVENVCAYLSEQFAQFPENARIYHGAVAQKNDVTPIDKRGIRHLQSLEGEFYVVIYPAEIATIIYWVVMAITAAFSIYTYMTMPKPQVSAPQSANNDLASRQNQARLGGRVPEIFGKLRAVPDLISAPFTYYDSQDREIEECLMVLGRSYYQIHDVREDTTNVLDIPNSAVSVYDPGTDITGTPIFQIGESFTLPPLMTTKSKSINGQTLDVPNDQMIESNATIFTYPNVIQSNDSNVDYRTLFSVGQTIGIYGAEYLIEDVSISGFSTLTLTKHLIIESAIDIQSVEDFKSIVLSNALIEVITEVLPIPPDTTPTYISRYYDLSGRYGVASVSKTIVSSNYRYDIALSGAELVNPNWNYMDVDKNASVNVNFTDNENSINLNGTYLITTVTSAVIALSSPGLTNGDWNKLYTIPNRQTVPFKNTIRLDVISNKWVGWFNIEQDNTDELVFNVFFQNGLFYQDSKGGVWEDSMTVRIEYQYLDSDNTPIGTITTVTHPITNSSKSPFGRTIRFSLPTAGRIRFRISRTTPTKNDKTQDLCKIKDVYASAKSNLLHYNDVTVVRTKTLGTEGALALKERKLNMLVTRKLPVNGTGALTPTRSSAQALIYLALDNKNGRRTVNEVDIAQIINEEQTIINYFNSSKAAEFSYTIDDANLSFEEIAGMIASACFSEPARFGSKLRLNFEQPKNIPVLLFNHRNKVPKSEKRTYSFGITKDYDGIELEYTSPDDDARITYIIPADGSAKNLMSIKSTGIRTAEQAKTRAWREWNKLFYQRVSCKFDALDESNLLARNDPILVADNVMVDTQDGEVESVNGLTLNLSQSVDIQVGDSIYLQMPDGTVELIGCQPGAESNQVILNRAPVLPLVVDNDRYVKTTYQIVRAGEASKSLFVLTEMTPQSKMTNSLTCVNYDDRYYEKDHTFF